MRVRKKMNLLGKKMSSIGVFAFSRKYEGDVQNETVDILSQKDATSIMTVAENHPCCDRNTLNVLY